MPPQPPTGTRIGRMLAGTRRVWSALRQFPVIADALLVLVLLLVSHPRRGSIPGGPASWAWLLLFALVIPLIWRRRAPFVVFMIVAAVALVQWFARELLAADLAPLVAFYTVAAYETGRRIAISAVILEIGAAMAAIRFAPQDGTIWAFVFISVLVAAAGVIGYNIRTRRAYLAALEDRAARLERERDQEAHIAAAAERARIAREMHDVVAHNIAVMIALADGAAYTTRSDPDQATTIMSQVSGTGRSALAEMRRLLGVMRDPGETADHAPQPTIADIDDLLSKVRAAGLPTRFVVTGTAMTLPPSAQLAIYRMVQEALTNTLKHADATRADVALTYLDDAVDLTITNDGSTLSPAPAGHGIAGMRERAAVFDGEVDAGPLPGGGWRVHAVLNLASTPVSAVEGADLA
jgi:signal transduction histidine kinase